MVELLSAPLNFSNQMSDRCIVVSCRYVGSGVESSRSFCYALSSWFVLLLDIMMLISEAFVFLSNLYNIIFGCFGDYFDYVA